jgi:quercetin dioxygenase-like cupin family protein
MINITPAHTFNYSGSVLNIYHADKGEGLIKHEHSFNHATMCVSGSIIIRKEGKEIIADKNTQPFDLTANEWHEIEALEDGSVFINVFAESNNY